MIPRISPILLRTFTKYVRWYLPRHFHRMRLLAGSLPKVNPETPLVIYLNHPGWWDPLVCLLLSQNLWPARQHFGPMDSEAIERYRFFKKLGFFGIDQSHPRGGITFLRSATEILRQPGGTLWITAQGEFTDTRQRPIVLRPGLAHLLRRAPAARVIPMAIEYPFWTERLPESLIAFGDPIDVTGEKRSAAQWNEILVEGLTATADRLALATITREPTRFDTLLEGGGGVGIFYDLWRRTHAALSGKRYRHEHGTEVP